MDTTRIRVAPHEPAWLGPEPERWPGAGQCVCVSVLYAIDARPMSIERQLVSSACAYSPASLTVGRPPTCKRFSIKPSSLPAC